MIENYNMDIDPINYFKTSGFKNWSLSDKPPSIKLAKITQKSIFSTTNRNSCLIVEDDKETMNLPQNQSNEASDDNIEPTKPPPSPPPITVQSVLYFVAFRKDFI